MKTKKYTIEDEHFSGFVETKLLSYPERLRLLAKIRIIMSDANSSDSFEAMARQVEVMLENVTGCEITHKATGQVFKDLSELGFYNEGSVLISNLSAEFLKGETLGKSQGTP
jgi:hypothetical protein